MDYEVTPDEIRIKVGDDDYAVLAYHLDGNRIFLDSTFTPERHRGQGIGSKLVIAAIEYARTKGYAIVPICPFTVGYFKKHPEYGEMLEKGI